MFDTLLASYAIGAPWTRAVIAALILHILLIAAAVSRTAASSAGTRPVARDTIRLELAEMRPSLPQARETSPSRPETIVPAPPGVPDIPLHAPEVQLPSFTYTSPGRPQSSPGFLHPSSGESAGSRDTMRLVSPSALSGRATTSRCERDGAGAVRGEKRRFKPARRGGRPTAVLVQQTIRFSFR